MNATRSSSAVKEFFPTFKVNLLIGNFPMPILAALVAIGFAIESSQAAGTVAAWGDNSHAQTNVPPGRTNVLAVAPAA